MGNHDQEFSHIHIGSRFTEKVLFVVICDMVVLFLLLLMAATVVGLNHDTIAVINTFCTLIASNDSTLQEACVAAVQTAEVNSHEAIHQTNLAFILLGSFLVAQMQIGFAFYELGLVRSKNARSVLFKLVFSFCFTPLVWWLWGMEIAGDSVCYGDFEQNLDQWKQPVYFLHSLTIALFSGALLSGAVTERMTFEAFVATLVFISSIIFPSVLYFVWGTNGFLRRHGYIDYGGGSAGHVCSGMAALTACIVLGPRWHRFSQNSEGELVVHNLPAHSPIFAGLGTLFLLASWFAFLGTAAVTNDDAQEDQLVDTAAAAVANALMCVCVSMCLSLIHHSHNFGTLSSDVMNISILSALTAITPCAAYLHAWSACVLGVLSFCISNLEPFIYILFKFQIDDPCEITSVYLFQSILGLAFVGVFGDPELINNGRYKGISGGLVYSGSFELLSSQLVGIIAILAFTFVCVYFYIILVKKFAPFPLRVPKHDELLGLDVRYYDGYAYPDMTKHMLRMDKDYKDAEKKLKHMNKKAPELVLTSRRHTTMTGPESNSRPPSIKRGPPSTVEEEEEEDDNGKTPPKQNKEKSRRPSVNAMEKEYQEDDHIATSRFKSIVTNKNVRSSSFTLANALSGGDVSELISQTAVLPDDEGFWAEERSPMHRFNSGKKGKDATAFQNKL